jgi:hypothetical protein
MEEDDLNAENLGLPLVESANGLANKAGDLNENDGVT